jgi:hypothetical protein
MSSSKFIKIQSQQNANFTASNNRLDFIIPADMGIISPKDCFLQLYYEITTDSPGLVPAQLSWTSEATVKFNNIALIKNADVKSVNKGQIDTCRRVDILRNNLMDIVRSTEQQLSSSYIDANQFTTPLNQQNFSIFQQYNKEGSHYSRNAQNVPIEIRLGDVLDFFNGRTNIGMASTIDLAQYGDMRVHLELNLDKVEAALIDISGVFANNNNLLADIAGDAGGQTVTSNTTKTVFQNLAQSPYYVGMPITLTYTSSTAGAGQTHDTVITNIVYNNNGTLTITWADDLVLAANEATTLMAVTFIQATSATGTFYMAELVVKQENVKPAGVIEYHQFNTYELNGNGLASYNNIIEIEGEASTAIIIPVDGTNGLQGKLDTLTNWRLYLNNYNLTDREEYAFSSLATDRLVKALSVLRYPAKNLSTPLYGNNTIALCSANTQKVIASPLFYTGGRKNLQITATSGGLNNYVLYTSIPKTIKV